jgi:hypothetical protein
MEDDDFFSLAPKKEDIELIDDFNILLNQQVGNYYIIVDSNNDFLIAILNSIEIIKPETTTKTKTKKLFPSTAKFTFTNHSNNNSFNLNKYFLGSTDSFIDQGGELLKEYRIIKLEDETLKDNISLLTSKVSVLITNKTTFNPTLVIKNEKMSFKTKYLKYKSKYISLKKSLFIN